MADSNSRDQSDPHDVLAAEEFGVPAPDPRLHVELAHDVLAAEGFGVPAPDPELTTAAQRPLVVPSDPDDPAGTEPARDVLAAEEFAVPAAERHAVPPDFTPGHEAPSWRGRIQVAGGALAGAIVLTRLRSRRRARRAQG